LHVSLNAMTRGGRIAVVVLPQIAYAVAYDVSGQL
jgi:hypothetical protein